MTKTLEIEIALTRAQNKFLQSESRGAQFIGGIGSGKTFCLGLWAIGRAMRGRRVCLVSFSYPTLRDVVLDTIKKLLIQTGLIPEADFSIKESTMTIKLWAGEILLRSGDRPDSLRGLNLDDFGIDEAREFPSDEVFKIMLGRIRESEDGQWRIASTSKGHNWVWELGQSCQVVSQSTFANPFLPEAYKAELRARYTGMFAKQELEAEICDFGAGIILPHWFKVIDAAEHNPKSKIVRYWDLAVSTKTAADESAGAKCSIENDRFVIHDIQHGRLAYPDLRRAIVAVAQADGQDCIIAVEEAGQQLGFIDDLRTIPELRGYTIAACKPRGDKVNRVMPWAARAEAGWVDIVRGEWNAAFKNQCEQFTADDTHAHDDLIDSVSGAYQECAIPKPRHNFRTLE
jgi:predicted phage terminase large subunit-like protein